MDEVPPGPVPAPATALERLKPAVLAVAVAGAGGAVCAALGMPLAWMIGAMLATWVGAISGLTLRIPDLLRTIWIIVLGVLLGSRFTPDMVDQFDRWTVTLAALVPHIAVSTAAGMAFLTWAARTSRPTAFFTAMPGGLSEMILVGTAKGGDPRVIALSHATRLMLVVLVFPVFFTAPTIAATGLVDVGPPTAPGWHDPINALLLTACAVGWPIAKLLRIPAAPLVGSMAASGLAHLFGLVEGEPPVVLVDIAQVVVGASVGCRFVGASAVTVMGIMLRGAGLTVVLFAVTLASAGLLSTATGIRFDSLVLAYAPGGLAEMSLVAISLDLDAAFVALHHAARVFLIVIVAPFAFRLVDRPRKTDSPAAKP